jgi:hypothetical protein
MKLTDEQAVEIGVRAIIGSGVRVGGVGAEYARKAGRIAFEESMRIALAVPSHDELTTVSRITGTGVATVDNLIGVFLASRIASYYEPQDRTVQRLQKWFESHGHPEFCMDPQPLEQLASIVIEEYEKRKKNPAVLSDPYDVAQGLSGGRQ